MHTKDEFRCLCVDCTGKRLGFYHRIATLKRKADEFHKAMGHPNEICDMCISVAMVVLSEIRGGALRLPDEILKEANG